jgi:SAM-dependent methyltransferase
MTTSRELYVRIREASVGVLDLISIQLGRRLGLYAALGVDDEVTASELADRTHLNARMVREWLEQQAVTGFVDLVSSDGEPDQWLYRMPDATREAFTDPDSLSFAAPMADDVLRVPARVDDLEEAFRTGTGLHQPYHWVEGRPDGTRSMFLKLLGSEWLPSVPELHQRLSSAPAARIADIGVGSGWSSIAMAQAYPQVLVDGYDLDEIAIGYAQQHARDAGVHGRVSFLAGDVTRFDTSGRYDLVTIFEALHDLSQPIAVLAQLRATLAEGGSVLVADERVPDQIVAPGTVLERAHYGWSVLNCLPAAMTDPDSAETGAVMRVDTLRRYAAKAGYSTVDVLPIDHDEWRFYRLHP